MQRFAQAMVAGRWPLLAAGLVATLAAWLTARPLPYDQAIEHMFPASDPARQSYAVLAERFGAHEVVLAVYLDPGLWTPEGLQRQAELAGRLSRVTGVRAVLGLNDLNRALAAAHPLSRDRRPAVLGDDLLAARFRELFSGYTHGADGQTASVACLLAPETEATPRRRTIDDLNAVIEAPGHGLAPGVLAGEPVLVTEGFRHVDRDGRVLAWASTGLLALTLAFCFRSLRWVLIPLAVVQLTLLLTQAALRWAGLKMSLVSSMLPAMITVIAVAAVMHIIVRVRRLQQAGAAPAEALRGAIAATAPAIFWASITDAVGFGSLLAATVAPVRQYGVMMALGALLVLASAALLIPGMALLGRWDLQPRRAWGEGGLDWGLRWSDHLSRWRPGVWTAIFMSLAAGACWGLLRLEVETDFTRNFRAGSPIVRSYEEVESRLGGAGVWDIMAPAPAQLDEAYLQRVLRLEEALRAIEIDGEPGLTQVLSLADPLDAMSLSRTLRWTPYELRAAGVQATLPDFYQTLRRSGEPSWIRIMLRARERQPTWRKNELIAKVEAAAAREFPGSSSEPPAVVTGVFVLFTRLIDATLRDQWTCFGLSAGGIFLSLLIALRSARLAAAALLTNTLPVLVLLGLLGWSGVRVNLGVAMIAAVSVGLSVDSSLHFLLDYRGRRAAGKSQSESLAEVQQTVGRAVVFSTAALTLGFLTLASSDFMPTVTFGVLSALAMLGGLFGNLFLLPVLMRLLKA